MGNPRRFRWQVAADIAERLCGSPEIGPVKRLVYGLVFAALPVGLGALAFYYALAYYKGPDWVAFALALVSGGMLLHFRYFWAPVPYFRRFGQLAAMVSLVVLVASVGFLCVAGLLSLAREPRRTST